MKFLVDECVDASVIAWLRNQRYDVVAIIETSLSISDMQVLQKALVENRILVTMDKDFGELVFNSRLPHGGVLLLRLENSNSSEKIEVVRKILERHSYKLLNKFSVFKDGRLRIRK